MQAPQEKNTYTSMTAIAARGVEVQLEKAPYEGGF